MSFWKNPDDRAQISERLSELIDSLDCHTELKDGMRHALRGGKMLRPRLLTAAAAEYGRIDRVVVDFACAIELLHTASLVHDDLPCIDNDLRRRGQPSNFARFGEGAAVLQGDALMSFGFSVLLEAAGSSVELRAARYIARAAGADGMLSGQYEDVSLTNKRAGETELDRIHTQKTARMFAAAICGGALTAGVEDISELERQALALGRAFQIADDLIDAGYGVAQAGKTLGKDAANGKNTFVTLYGAETAQTELRALTRRARYSASVLQEFSDFIADSVFVSDGT